MMPKKLTTRTEILIRFNEADPLGIVWHGHYIRYFEDAREAFGKEYNMGYMHFFKQGVVVPIVHAECNYKKSVKFGETIWVDATFIPTEAAKIKFEYTIYNAANQVVATGSTVQVFLDKETQTLQLVNPPFFDEWKLSLGL